MKKPVNLTAHKSQIERKRRKDVRKDMETLARGMASSGDIVAYAIVGITADGSARAVWDTGGAVPMWAFPATVREILSEDMMNSGAEEDFRRPLLDRAWKGSK